MSIKVTKLSDTQIKHFKIVGSAMGSLATLPMPGTYPVELKNCGINERGTPNQLVGYIVTQPSGSQLAIETVFYDWNIQQKTSVSISATKSSSNILFSGDSDFDYLVKILRLEGKSVIVISTKHHISKELIISADRYIDLKKLKKELI